MKRYSISQRKKSRGNLTWYGRTYENGVLVSEVSLATKRKSDALLWLDSMNAAKFLPENMFKIEEKDMDLQDAVRKFVHVKESEKGPDSATARAYRSRMTSWQYWCALNGIRSLRAFSREKAVEYASETAAMDSPKTAHEKIRLLRQFTDWAAETFEISDWTPMKTVKAPKQVKRSKSFWKPEEIDAILDKAPDREFRLFWALMAFAGLRHAEACAFGKSSIVEGKIKVIGKGDKEAYVPIGDRLKKELSMVKVSDGMFDTVRFSKPDRCMPKLRTAVRMAGMEDADATNHKFRHSFASNLIRAGVNVKAVQQLMRHENIQVTLDTYSHLLKEDLKDAANAIK